MLTGVLSGVIEFAELLANLSIFEVDALDFVVGTATFDGGPFDDAGRGRTHRMRVGGEGDDARAVVEFDIADFDFFGKGGGAAIGIERVDLEDVLAVAEDGAGEAEHVGEVVNVVHVFEGAGIVFGDEEVIAFGEAQAFADIFEAVAEGPADANGFFGEGEGWYFGLVERVFSFDPTHLVVSEVLGQQGGGVYFDERQDGGHRLVKWVKSLNR